MTKVEFVAEVKAVAQPIDISDKDWRVVSGPKRQLVDDIDGQPFH